MQRPQVKRTSLKRNSSIALPRCRYAGWPARRAAHLTQRRCRALQRWKHPQFKGLATRAGDVSSYAWGEDYHRTLGVKLHALAQWLHTRCGGRGAWYVAVNMPRNPCDLVESREYMSVVDVSWEERGPSWLGPRSGGSRGSETGHTPFECWALGREP
jgi:hypothetical protein